MFVEVCDCCEKKIEHKKHSIEYSASISYHNGDVCDTTVILCQDCMVEAVIDLMIKHNRKYEPHRGAYEIYYPLQNKKGNK